jgi:DNA-binding XRE family transcriptional regulator
VERETKIKYIRNRLDLTPQNAAKMFDYLKSHWSSAKVSDMAKQLNLSQTTVRSIARKINLGPRPERASHLDPSRDEIKRLAAEIRKTWSPAEKARRDLLGRSEAGRGRRVVSLGIEAPSFARNWL